MVTPSSPTATNDEPRTETNSTTVAGQRLIDRQELMREHGTRGLFSVNLGDILAIEAEARSAALTEVEEAVAGLHRPGRSDINYRAVLAAITGLRR